MSLPSAPQPQTTPLCLRYKFQPPKQQQPQAPAHGSQKQVPLPPPPATGVSVDLFDNDGKHISNIPLNASDGEFFAVVPVPMPQAGEKAPLTQYFRFVVDGRRGMNHPHLPVMPLPGSNGENANYVHVTHPDAEALAANAAGEALPVSKDGAAPNKQQQGIQPGVNQPSGPVDDDEVGWSQHPPQFEETRKFPPMMPPHLRYTPLNAPPSQTRCDADGNFIPESDAGGVDGGEGGTAVLGPEHRPAPLSVTINHIYFQRREDHTLVGITTRYQDKCTSIAYYKHDPLPAGAVPLPMPLQR